MASDGRHLSPAALSEFVAAGVPTSIPIPGEPSALLTIDPTNNVMRLQVGWDGEQPPPIQRYLHLSTDVIFHSGANWAVISVRGIRYFQEAYPLLCSVADLVQLDGLTFAGAVLDSLRTYHDLLAATASMSAEDETGLHGELLVLRHLIGQIGATAALGCWRGSTNHEEHDFGLTDGDVEVKTTVGEGRRHWIGSLDQLSPTVGRPLWLLSVQLTTAGLGDGQRLPELVNSIEQFIPANLIGQYRAHLDDAGFRETQPVNTFRALRPRTLPACYRVDDQFPRLTRPMLQASGADLDRVGEVSYTIRLDNVQSTETPPAALIDLVSKADAP